MDDPRARPAGAGSVFTGNFHPELEDALLALLAGGREADPLAALRVVVPTNLLGLRLSRLLAERLGGHVNVRFLTFKDYALRLAGGRRAGATAMLPRGGDQLVLRRLIDEGLAAGGYFAGIADRPGLSTALASAIRDLKEASYDVESLAASARSAGLIKRGRSDKFAELIRIWNAYEERLARDGRADTLDAMRAAAEALETGGAAPAEQRTSSEGARSGEAAEPPTPLILYGFYDLNALQKRIVKAHVAAAGATVFFPYLDVESFRFALPTLEWLLRLGLERVRLDPDEARDLPLPTDTRIISAPGEPREAREDVRELASVLDSGSGTFQDTAILLRRSDSYAELFLEESARLGAKPYMEAPPPLSRTREARSLIALGEAAQEAFARVELMEFLNLADLDGTEGGVAPVGDWNKASILAGITSGAETWIPRLSELRTRLEEAPDDQRFSLHNRHLIEPIDELVGVVSRLAGRLSPVPPTSSVSGYLDLLLGAFSDITRDTPERRSVVGAAEGLRTLSDIAGTVSFPYFMELLRSRLDEPSARDQRFGEGGPSVINVMNARGLRFGTVIVPGLVEREFPASHRQDPILLDVERERLNRARGDDPCRSLPIRTASVDEERLLFRLAVGTAANVLILSYPRLDPSTARPRVPSVFLLQVLQALTGKRHDYEDLQRSPMVARVPLSRRFPEDRLRSLTDEEFNGSSVLAAIRSDEPSEIAYLVHQPGLRRRLLMEETRWGNPFFTEYDGVTASDAARTAVEELSGLSRDGSPTVAPTTLEDYARCPFLFFMRHVLGAETLPEPEETLSLPPLERGSLYHEVLESFLRGARDGGSLPLTQNQRDTLFATAERVARSGKWSLASMDGARELELRNLLGSLALWLADETTKASPYVPRYFEARFGGRVRGNDDRELSTERGVPFEAQGGVKLSFSGKVDRIDVTDDGTAARVIDYKTGRPRSKGSKVLDRGRRLQLPIYLLATNQMLGQALPGAVVETAEYLYVSAPGGPRELSFGREELAAASEDLARAVGLVMHGIRSGLFFAYPPDPSECRNCDYADACSSTAVTLARMKTGDRQARFFVEDLVEVK